MNSLKTDECAERNKIMHVIICCKYRIYEAAKVLNMHNSTLYRKIKKYNLRTKPNCFRCYDTGAVTGSIACECTEGEKLRRAGHELPKGTV